MVARRPRSSGPRAAAGWEVEVKRADGSTVEVNLDQGYHVVGTQQDSENGDDDSGPGDD